MKNLYEDLGNMSKLASVGTALAQFVDSLTEGKGEFKLESREWVYRPHNFIAFRVQWKRKRSEKIVLSLWGSARRFEESPLLKLWRGRFSGYSSCEITSPRQLAAAAQYIEKAFELYRSRPRGRA